MFVAIGLVASLLLPAAFSTPSLIHMPTDDPVNPVSFARGLTLDYYEELCPDVRDLVRAVVLDALGEDMSIAAGLLRIFFHDCFPQGCDASILLNGTGTPFGEQQMPPNRGLQPKALQLIEEIRAKVHAVCGPTVSCADITSLATHDAVVASGGKPYYVPLGRMDSRSAAAWSYVRDLPHFTVDISEVIATFRSRRYFDATDVVALSGAHNIGKAHCSNFARGFRKEDSDFAEKLRKNCTAGVDDRMQYLDVNTPHQLDNVYYHNIKAGKGVLATDQLLNGDDRTRWLVDGFADDEWWFWSQFGTSMSKMGMLEGYFGNVGEVRHVSCSQRNPPASTA